jgi:hypothetical protein
LAFWHKDCFISQHTDLSFEVTAIANLEGMTMTTFKKTLIGTTVAMFLAVPAANASLVNVGGVIWDPNWQDGNDGDFQADSSFRQWFQTTNNGIDEDNLVGLNLGNANTAVFDNYLYGVGKFNNWNAANDITGQPNPETFPANFCPGCELTYEFGGIQLVENAPGEGTLTNNTTYTIDISNAYWNVYVDTNMDFNANSTSSILNATNGTLFLSGDFDAFTLATSGVVTELSGNAILGGSAQALLSATGGLALEYFDTNTFGGNGGPVSDLFYTASTQFSLNTDDVFFTAVATGEFQGDTVDIPEPGSLALLGLGLLGLAGMRRRGQKMV